MSLCKNLFNTFIEYLDIKDIMNLSLTSKANYQLVNENNPKVNSRWREECNKTFCDNETQEIMDEYYNIKYHNQDNEIINSEINWKGLFMVMKNQQKGLNKNLYGDTASMVYKMLKYHIYLPNLRKSSIFIDNNNCSSHQIALFEFEQEEKDIFTPYEYDFRQGNTIQEIREKNNSSFLENFITQFEIYKEEIKKDEDKKSLFQKIYHYNIDSTTSLSNSNHILNFMLWLYSTIKNFCTINLFYIRKYINEEDRFLHEYVNRHIAFVEASLCLKENLENVNIAINYIYKSIFGTENKNARFSMYKFLINIWYKEVFLSLNEILIHKIKHLIPRFITETLLAKQQETSYMTDTGFDDEAFFSIKNIFEKIASTMLDFSINEKTIKLYNHSDFPVTHHYLNFEKNLISGIFSHFQERLISRDQNFDYIFDLMNYVESDNCLFINRTKLRIITNAMLSIKESLVSKIVYQFNDFILERVRKNNLSSYQERDNDISNVYIRNKIKKELKDIENYLANLLIMQGFDREASMECSKNFINSKDYIVVIVNKMLNKFYENVEIFEITNKKINSSLNNNNINQNDGSGIYSPYNEKKEQINKTNSMNQTNNNDLFLV